ncbi:MAG: hypothetical protein AAF750_02030 [Planctomycetota bacterium]
MSRATPGPDIPFADDDFRLPAILASLQLHPIDDSADLGLIDASLCLPTEGNGGRTLRRMKWLGLALLLFGGLGLFLGWVISATPRIDYHIRTLLGAVLAGAGFICLLGVSPGPRLLADRSLKARPTYDRLRDAKPRPTYVGIENAATYQKFKAVPEDFAMAYADRDAGQLILEGIRCRYIIRREDLLHVGMAEAAQTTALQIDYRVGQEVVSIAVSGVSSASAILQGLTGRKTLPLDAHIQAVMGKPTEPPHTTANA